MKSPGIHDKTILLIDDEKSWLNALGTSLRLSGFTHVLPCQNPAKAMDILREQPVEVVLLDIFMPQVQGDELLKRIHAEYPHVTVFMVTAVNDIEKAVECMRNGADNYVLKPAHTSQLVGMIVQALSMKILQEQHEKLCQRFFQDELETPEAFRDIFTADRGMQLLFSYIEMVASTLEPVLITGETGVGKELVARALHRCSGRNGHFVAVNVAGLDDTAFSDTLFGHKRGAFTGATDDRKGLIEQARGGTLFLDEMGSLDAHSQVKLLRLIQEGEYMPLGMDTPRTADVRLLAATNKDIKALQAEGAFRKDLYYRLNTHHVHVPPLRERLNDISLLAANFLDIAAKKYNKPPASLSEAGYRVLRCYAFPGNVRELRALMLDAGARYAGAEIPVSYFDRTPAENANNRTPDAASACVENILASLRHLPSLHDIQQILIQEALKRTGGNQSAAAGILGISRQALHQRLKNHGS